MSQPEALTQTEAALEEFRNAGVPIEKSHRTYKSKRMEGFNAEVYSAWIEHWVVNSVTNFPIIRKSEGVGFLRNVAKDVPAVVVGIGPSLDDAINDLKISPRHAVIIATDAALRPLARHGIHPDLVINFDARDHQASMWETIDTSPYVLLANSVTSPLTIDAWKGAAMFFNMMQSDDEFATNILPCMYPFLGQLPNQGTVGNGAVFLAYQMGCKPILTVGMDLCYRKEQVAGMGQPTWKYRCKDWHLLNGDIWADIENKALYDNDERMAKAMDEEIKGQTYKTDECLRFYRNSLVSSVGQFDLPLINCSGGVLQDLVKSMTLRQALQEKCYAALDPGRTIMKHLKAVLPDAKKGWTLDHKERIFIPTAGSWPPNPNEVMR